MNDEAREVLVAAGLRGHEQAQGRLHSRVREADCALGVLHLTMHQNRREALACSSLGILGWSAMQDPCLDTLLQRYAITSQDEHEIIRRNDEDGWDFLTIARKVGLDALP